MTFVWEPVPKAPGDRRTDEPARVALMVLGDNGAAYFRGRVPDVALAGTAPSIGAAAAASGSTGGVAPRGPSRVTFDAQPGKAQLRVSVEGTSAQVLDSETREISVPDLTSPQTALGTPEVFRARTVRVSLVARSVSVHSSCPLCQLVSRTRSALASSGSVCGPGVPAVASMRAGACRRSAARSARASTTATLASMGMSQTAIVRIWRDFGLQPHRTDTFRLSSDPTRPLLPLQPGQGSSDLRDPEPTSPDVVGCVRNRAAKSKREQQNG